MKLGRLSVGAGAKAAVALALSFTIIGGSAAPAFAGSQIKYYNHCQVQHTGFHNGSASGYSGSTRRAAATSCGGSIGLALKTNGWVVFGPSYTSANYIGNAAGAGYYGPYQAIHYLSGSLSYFTTNS